MSTLHSSDHASASSVTSAEAGARLDSTGMAPGPWTVSAMSFHWVCRHATSPAAADRHRRGDVLAGLLGLAEAPPSGGPAHQVAHRVADLLDDEGLDDRLLDEAEVDQQLAQSPALQLVALSLKGLGESLGCQCAGRPGGRRGTGGGLVRRRSR